MGFDLGYVVIVIGERAKPLIHSYLFNRDS